MKNLILFTAILVTATALMTVLYFKNLNLPRHNTADVMQTIPADAALIFELTNDESFYNIYDSSALFTSLAGKEQIHELNVLRNQIFENAALKPYFTNQLVYVSVHPQGELLFTVHTPAKISGATLSTANKQIGNGIKITPIEINHTQGFSITLPQVHEKFNVIDRGNDIYSGSFSTELILNIAKQKNFGSSTVLSPLSDKQESSALANLYVNYSALSPLFDCWFKIKNTDFLKSLRLLPGSAALTLNYKSDALMLAGYSMVNSNLPATYLTLFTKQHPYPNRLKDIFPDNTATSTCFSLSNPKAFEHDLALWQNKAGLQHKRQVLMHLVKTETGVNLPDEFKNLLGNEFALINTQYNEQLAIIQVKDGSRLLPVFTNISSMNTDNIGRLNYSRLPFYLLGDAFTLFKQPYFTVVNNYLILGNTASAIRNYVQSYNNQHFLSKQEQYNEFDDLLTEQCNIAFFICFKNANLLLRHDLRPGAWKTINSENANGYYAGAYQLSSTNNQFYTNLCLQLNRAGTSKLNK